LIERKSVKKAKSKRSLILKGFDKRELLDDGERSEAIHPIMKKMVLMKFFFIGSI